MSVEPLPPEPPQASRRMPEWLNSPARQRNERWSSKGVLPASYDPHLRQLQQMLSKSQSDSDSFYQATEQPHLSQLTAQTMPNPFLQPLPDFGSS
jgi:hypothetical protein